MTKPPRNHDLDLARGLCLVLMTVDHLPHNVLSRFSNFRFGPFGVFTAASAFVFISGLVSARVYSGTLVRDGLAAAWRRVLRRAAQLYAVNTGLLLLLLAGVSLHVLTGEVWRQEFPLMFSDPWLALGSGLLMLYRPGFLDILPMYVGFLLVTIPALAMLRAGLHRELLLLSALVWVYAQTMSSDVVSLNPLGYQLLFIVGMVLSVRGEAALATQAPSIRWLGVACVALAGAGIVARFWMGLARFDSTSREWTLLVHLETNGPLRVLNFGVFALALLYLWPRVPVWIKSANPFARFINLLGRHSLPVFAWSILMTYVSLALMPERPGRLWSLLDILLTVSSLAVPALIGARLTKWRDVSASGPVPLKNGAT